MEGKVFSRYLLRARVPVGGGHSRPVWDGRLHQLRPQAAGHVSDEELQSSKQTPSEAGAFFGRDMKVGAVAVTWRG